MHKEFAEIYDLFMKNTDYKDWYKFLRNYIQKKGEILDLGCGTGEFIHRFVKDGFYVTGIDLSEDMIRLSKEKLTKMSVDDTKYDLKIEDIRTYEHTKEVDYIICNFDTVNYFSSTRDFEKFLENSNANLKKEGYLIFDVVTEEIFEEIFENGIFLDEEPEYTSIWRYEKKSKKKYFVEIDLFVKQKDGGNIFKKYNEQHEKYMYDPEWIIETARKKNFEVYDVASNPKFGESRIFFVFKKKVR